MRHGNLCLVRRSGDFLSNSQRNSELAGAKNQECSPLHLEEQVRQENPWLVAKSIGRWNQVSQPLARTESVPGLRPQLR